LAADQRFSNGIGEWSEGIVRHEHADAGASLCRFAAGTIVKITYGHTVTSMDDRYVQLAERALSRSVALASVGAMIVDLIPFRTLLFTPSHG
jgi:hypothetical protein